MEIGILAKGKVITEIYSWTKALAAALVISLLIRAFIFEPVRVDGPSMENTLTHDERLIIYKASYIFGDPEFGDIVVLEMNTSESVMSKFIPFLGRKKSEIDFIKRIIGVPGDKIDIINGQVYRNDEPLNEPYARGITFPNKAQLPIVVSEGQYFVLGDNRTNSSDSRNFGCIDRKRVRGKAVFRIFPFDRIGVLK